MTDEVLVRLYDAQPINVDKLGGTLHLTVLTEQYYRLTRVNMRESEVLSRLIQLRKRGLLANKSDRTPRETPKPTWPQIVDKAFYVKVPVSIDEYKMTQIIVDYFNINKRLPVTRQEIYDHLIEYPDSSSPYEGDRYEDPYPTIRRLFPEFKT